MRIKSLWLAVFLLFSPPLHAEEVTIEHDGLDLVGQLEIADGKSIKKDGVLVIAHDSFEHFGAAPIPQIQSFLKLRGINSLAINFSYGLDQRRGMHSCDLEHDNRPKDDVAEISAWLTWLKGQKASNVTLLGFGAGAAEITRYAHSVKDKKKNLIAGLVLINPAYQNSVLIAQSYQKSYKRPLAKLLEKANKLVADGEGDSLISDIGFLHCPNARATANSVVENYRLDQQGLMLNILPDLLQPIMIITLERMPFKNEFTRAVAALQHDGAINHVILRQMQGENGTLDAVGAAGITQQIQEFISQRREQ